MSDADIVSALMVGVAGGFGAWIGLRGKPDVSNPVGIAAICGVVGAASFLILRPVLFGA